MDGSVGLGSFVTDPRFIEDPSMPSAAVAAAMAASPTLYHGIERLEVGPHLIE